MTLDGQPGAHDIGVSFQPKVFCVDRAAAPIYAERQFLAEIDVLILGTDDHIQVRSSVDHTFNAGACKPTVIVRFTLKAACAGRARAGELICLLYTSPSPRD